MALFVLHKRILQMRVCSHSTGIDIWLLIGPFIYFHILWVRTAKALGRLRKCAGSPEPSPVTYLISAIISWAGSYSHSIRIKKHGEIWAEHYRGQFDNFQTLKSCLYRATEWKIYVESCRLGPKIFMNHLMGWKYSQLFISKSRGPDKILRVISSLRSVTSFTLYMYMDHLDHREYNLHVHCTCISQLCKYIRRVNTLWLSC